MNCPFLNTAVKLFLQELHPDLIKAHPTVFLDNWATWVKTEHPATWNEFPQHVRVTYTPGPWTDYLLSYTQPAH